MSRQRLKDSTMLRMAITLGGLATCGRRMVGCILTDSSNRIIGSGYNGPARGETNCTEKPCAGAKLRSGEGLDKCEAIHAEANALMQCRFPDNIYTAYCSTSPCIHCVKLLMNTGCVRIIFDEAYPHDDAKDLWEAHGGEWIKL